MDKKNKIQQGNWDFEEKKKKHQLEMSEMKTSVNHIKNIIEIISNRLDQAKERLSEIEDEVKKYYIWTAIKEKQIWPQLPGTLRYQETKPKNPWGRRKN